MATLSSSQTAVQRKKKKNKSLLQGFSEVPAGLQRMWSGAAGRFFPKTENL
jgi:uncharacterized protein YukE